MRLIYLFLLTHCCRPADARALQARHFNFKDMTVTIEQGFSGNVLTSTKTGNAYEIPIHPDLAQKLQAICISKMPNDFVFTFEGRPWGETTLRKKWTDAAEKAGHKIELYKGVKHASASFLAGETGDIFNISKLFGHANTNTAQKHYTVRTNIEKLRSIQARISIPEDIL